MSKIGRKPIDIGAAKVEIKGQEIHYSGKKESGVYVLPSELSARLEGTLVFISTTQKDPELNRIWGLHRALLANKIKGCQSEFAKTVEIVGLGFKVASVGGSKIVFSLGYSHKIDFELPKEVTLEVDKTGQKLVVRSPNKESLGLVCSKIRALRPPEPYKGTGIKINNEVIARKAGKTKASA